MWVARNFFSISILYVFFQQTKDRSVYYQYFFFTIVIVRFQSFSRLHLNLSVLYPTVTSEGVCCGIRNVKPLIKALKTCVVLSCL